MAQLNIYGVSKAFLTQNFSSFPTALRIDGNKQMHQHGNSKICSKIFSAYNTKYKNFRLFVKQKLNQVNISF